MNVEKLWTWNKQRIIWKILLIDFDLLEYFCSMLLSIICDSEISGRVC